MAWTGDAAARQAAAKAAVLEALDEDFLVGLARDLVRIPTVNPKFEMQQGLNREPELQAHLEGVMRAVGLATEQFDALPGRPNLRGSLPGSEARSLVLNGHVDVVPPGDLAKWTVDPFGGEIRDRRLYGRGAVDMKAGVATGVAVVKAIRDAGVELEGWLDLHAVVDEEAGGFGSMAAVKRWRTPAAVIVLEPTWGAIMAAEGGLDWVRVTIPGRSGHAGWRYNEIYPQPHLPGRIAPSVNAVELGSRFVLALREFERDRARRLWHPLMPPGVNSINPGVVVAGAGLGTDGRPAILGNAAIVPDRFVLDLDYKFLPQEDPREVRAEFERFVHHWAQTDDFLRENPPTVEWDLYGLHFPPLDTPVDHPLVQSLLANRAALGKPSEIKGFVAVCDVAFYSGAGVPGVIHGAAGDGFHGTDEYVDIDAAVEAAKVIAATVIDWCGVR
jgi:acetylornithine deacetylase